jgi:hypothetical protein
MAREKRDDDADRAHKITEHRINLIVGDILGMKLRCMVKVINGFRCLAVQAGSALRTKRNAIFNLGAAVGTECHNPIPPNHQKLNIAHQNAP